ncbi:hypothetical protein KW785_00985 [Candidatus Parcubacteria bacterium]|nr:hypothetical protein [Candidatus Parcubacteria bacterium]
MQRTLAIVFERFRGNDLKTFVPEIGRWYGEPMGKDIMYLGPLFVPDKESVGMLDTSDARRWLCVRSRNSREIHGLKFEEVRLFQEIKPGDVPLDKEARRLAAKIGWK